ncbi:integrase, catalytic region, zinc finger, CCHC-type containing protein, partial [Tanacetum coccineum]
VDEIGIGKSKKHTHKPKSDDSIQEKLYLLHMDLDGPMRTESINGKKYILVIVDDYSWFTWVEFLQSKDETPEFARLFLWAEAVATTCYTQNCSLIHKHHNKTPYELIHDRTPDLTYFHVFGALCYPTNDGEDLDKLKPKADIGIFIGYTPAKKAYRIYNKRTRFSGLVQNPFSSTPYVPPTKKDWDILFQPMFDEYFQPPPTIISRVLPAVALIPDNTTGSPSSTFIDQDAPTASTSPTSTETKSLVICEGVEEQLQPAHFDNDPFHDILTSEPSSQESSSNVQPANLPFEHLSRWTKDHPLDNGIVNLSRLVSTRRQLQTYAMWCFFDAFLTLVC